MRLLAFAVLGACSFSPGALPSGDGGGVDARVVDGSLIDTSGSNTTVDAPLELAKVRRIEITDARVAGGPHVDFPLLVSLTGTWLRTTSAGGDVAGAAGHDIYFSADQAGQQRLAHDVEVYDGTAGTFTAWVKIPSLTAATVVFLHYGDPAITTSQQNVTDVWSAGYELVSHLDGSGDATEKNAIVTAGGVTTATGRIGEARDWDGSTAVANAGTNATIDDIFAGGGSIEAWFRPEGYGGGGFGRILDKGGYGLFVDNTNGDATMSFYHACVGGNGYGQWTFDSDIVTLNAWNHVVVVFNRDNQANVPTLIVNGTAYDIALVDTVTGAFTSDAIENLYLGNIGTGGRSFNGVLDEIRVASMTRTDAWVLTEYRNQSDPATFYTVSNPL